MPKTKITRNYDRARNEKLRTILLDYVSTLTEPTKRVDITTALETKLAKLGTLPTMAIKNALDHLADNKLIRAKREGRDWEFWGKKVRQEAAEKPARSHQAKVAGLDVAHHSDARPHKKHNGAVVPDMSIDLIKETNRARITLRGGAIIEVGVIDARVQ